MKRVSGLFFFLISTLDFWFQLWYAKSSEIIKTILTIKKIKLKFNNFLDSSKNYDHRTNNHHKFWRENIKNHRRDLLTWSRNPRATTWEEDLNRNFNNLMESEHGLVWEWETLGRFSPPHICGFHLPQTH